MKPSLLLSLPKPIKILPDKILRELIVAFKANGYCSAVFWDIIGFKDIVPKAQANTIVHTIFTFRKCICMMVKVHDRIIEDILEWPPGDLDVGVVKVTNRNGNKMHNIGLLGFKAT